MTTASPLEEAREDDGALLSSRLFGAVEVLVGAHAARAQREVTDDAKRVVSGAILLGIAACLAVPFVFMVDLATAVALVEYAKLDVAVALVSVAIANALAAAIALSMGRARLRAPILKETRATLRRAATVLRG